MKNEAGRGVPAICLAAILTCALPARSLAVPEGQARVIDGDTLDIQGEHFRLSGIDAPETGQICQAPDGEYYCGREARSALANLVFEETVTCEGNEKDRYGRTIATCYIGCGRTRVDLGSWMVSHGWALAYRQYSGRYVLEEEAAKVAKVGLWGGQFDAPWDWRKHRTK